MGRAKIKAPSTLFLPCQAKWIKDQSRMKIAEKARQIGFTWCSSYADMTGTARANNHIDTWITSRDALQAKLYIQDCLNWSHIYGLAAKAAGEQVLLDEGGKKQSAQVLRCANGQAIYSLSSNGDAQAGKRGNRRADEFALNPDNRHLYGIMYPGITWAGNLWIWSTHRGSQNYFNQLIQEIREGGNPKGFSLHRITLEDALNEGLLDKLQQKWPQDDPRQEYDETDYFNAVRRECADEETFLQEYMCIPSDDAGAFISYDLIDASVYPAGTAWEEELNPAAHYVLGGDIGRVHDLTVLWLLQVEGKSRRTVRIIELANMPFSEQAAVIDKYAAMPWVKRVCLDATGIGRQLAEDARRRHGGKVEEVQFTAGVKEDLAITLRRCMEDGEFRMPNKPELISDFRSIRKETTSAGNVRYVGERTSNGHADRFWAAALAIHAAKEHGTCSPRRWAATGRTWQRWKGAFRR